MGMSCKNTINKEKDANPKVSREKRFIFRGFRTIYESFFYKSLRDSQCAHCVHVRVMHMCNLYVQNNWIGAKFSLQNSRFVLKHKSFYPRKFSAIR